MGTSESGDVQVGKIPENQAKRGTRPFRQCSRHHNYRRIREIGFNDYTACNGLGETEWLLVNLEKFVVLWAVENASLNAKTGG